MWVRSLLAGLVCLAGLASGGEVAAQSVLRDGRPTGSLPGHGVFTMRPEAGLETLAAEVASVLELRTGAEVEVGEPPPPGLAEAVPAGHVALVRTDAGLLLVLGAVGGRSLATRVDVAADQPADARALALAVESLHDSALDIRAEDVEVVGDAGLSGVREGPAAGEDAYADGLRPRGYRRARFDDSGDLPGAFREPRFLDDVELLTFVRAYGGASAQSTSLESGLGGGLGVCSIGQCLVLAAELPLTDAATTDLRYRYNTYTVAFYSRPEPLAFGDFTPGASLGLLTRVGHFNDDMGLDDEGLDTDLAARASLELAWLAHDRVDLVVEGGADYLLDRFFLSDRSASVTRGDRVSPWVQASVRFRPY